MPSIAGARLEAPAPGMPTAIGDTRATIRAIGPARFSRAQFQPDEIVRLDDGEIELEIAPLHAHERFRVVTDDGEVEVRGTRFKVSVIDHHLAAVHVWKGQVEVRSSGGAQAILAPGDDWVRAGLARRHAAGGRTRGSGGGARADDSRRRGSAAIAAGSGAPGKGDRRDGAQRPSRYLRRATSVR